MPLFGLARDATALVVAPHPDDETLGAGATIARLTTSGVTVHVLAVACGNAATAADIRAAEFDRACDALGVSGRRVAWSDERAGTVPERPRILVELIEHDSELSLAALRPELFLIPAASGFHQDHQAVHHACFAAARAGGPHRHTPPLVLGFKGPEDGWTTASEPWRIHVNTSRTWDAKKAALAAYGSQMREAPHPRSVAVIHASDTATGSLVGATTAESFVPYRMAYR
ncbi:PIG-L deacetylase family protein [Streptomyces sp. 4N509B]|uniref:PIG-L deacetylase family protein n=1 Tax=Streptomyces sp. 4N509B TaxID=3457413 RepID=UPI003FD47321